MSKLLLTLFAFLPMFLSAQNPYASQRLPVNGQWQFRQGGTADWRPTAVPTSIHTALLRHKMIDDPFYRDNEEKLQWIEQQDWEFETTFDVDPAALQRRHVELVLNGLDTYAHVYLNDSLVLETDNMFRRWTADVKKLLKPQGNKLHIYLESPVKKVDAAWKALGYELPGGVRTMTRKAQFHYGWDWGPRFAGVGILKTPELLVWDEVLLENVFITATSIDSAKAEMVARFRYRSDFHGPVSIVTRNGKNKAIENRVLDAGIHEDSVTFDVPNPQLWWSNGLGEPYLYDFSLEVKRGARVVDQAAIRTGIRTIELVTEKDKDGETFYFRLNGKPVFAKGANYIPQDIFQDRVTPNHYRRLIDDVVASNMNMLRVWGGGIYEDDTFYQLCDAHGILVWQDFMYACALYPGNGAFLKTAAQEAFEQIERLRQHPSVALFCGNNENNEAWHNWGWQTNFTEAQRQQLWRDYQTLFNDLLPAYVANYGGGIPYWESSPSYGRANPKSLTEGDSHYWGVWHDAEPFAVFDRKVPRFMSEYGFQSFPEWRTIESFTEPADRQLESKVMLVHQKHPRGNALIAEYLKRDYREPKTFEDFVYISQLVQAEGMRTGIEAHRRAKPYCMGTLYWQLNDVWPVASWSGRDYFGRWKALQYYVRDAFSPVAALPRVDGETLQVYGVSDHAGPRQVRLAVRALDFDGKILSETDAGAITLSPDASTVVWSAPLKTVLRRADPNEAVVELVLRAGEGGAPLYRRLLYLSPPRALELPRAAVAVTAVEPADGGYRLTVRTDKLAKNVLLSTAADGFFQDNYFDLLPGETRTVLFKTTARLDNPAAAFRVRSLVDTY
jgi:beta-mannosidase